MMKALQWERYSRQILLSEIGESGQQKLLAAKVLVIGAGGLGCPVLQYLVAAGVGHMGIIDNDKVALSNLHRQVLFSTADVGKPKAVTAFQRLQLLNPDVQFSVYNYRLTPANAWNILSDYDLVIDGTDNFASRYLINDACVLLNKPLVYGSIFRFEGQVSFFNLDGSANYRHLFAEPPAAGEVPNCAEAGVIGFLPGIIGGLMANEAVKYITGTGQLLVNRVLTFNTLYNSYYEFNLSGSFSTAGNMPANRAQLEQYPYVEVCERPAADGWEVDDLNQWIDNKGISIIDVREPGEQPLIVEFEHEKIPLSQLRKELPVLTGETIVLFCQSGKRSLEAAQLLRAGNPHQQNIFSLKGGILKWKMK